MKKLIFSMLLMSATITGFAQESAAELKNAGNAAYTSNDFESAITKWEAYINTGDEAAVADYTVMYNIASSAFKIKKYDVAKKYFLIIKEKEFKSDLATFHLAMIEKALNNTSGYLTLLEEGVSKYATSKIFKNFVASISDYYNKSASEPFNKANKIVTEAASSGDGKLYLTKMVDALKLYDTAKTAFGKTLTYDANNATAKSALTSIENQIKQYEEYKKTLEKK